MFTMEAIEPHLNWDEIGSDSCFDFSSYVSSKKDRLLIGSGTH